MKKRNTLQKIITLSPDDFADWDEGKLSNKDVKDLIESNLRQRGDIGGSAKKTGKRIKELERIYGSKVGIPKNSEKISELSAQEKIAQKMDMDVRTLRNYKMLADMIPELDELVDTGVVIVK